MPLYDFECLECQFLFEEVAGLDIASVPCPACKSENTQKMISAPAFHIKGGNPATGRIEKRVKNYLKNGDFAGATRFADKAASMVKSDKVQKIADKLHQKTGK